MMRPAWHLPLRFQTFSDEAKPRTRKEIFPGGKSTETRIGNAIRGNWQEGIPCGFERWISMQLGVWLDRYPFNNGYLVYME